MMKEKTRKILLVTITVVLIISLALCALAILRYLIFSYATDMEVEENMTKAKEEYQLSKEFYEQEEYEFSLESSYKALKYQKDALEPYHEYTEDIRSSTGTVSCIISLQITLLIIIFFCLRKKE